MQYPVPQFTDVEDRIIGPLTLKQFLIIFGAGIVVFLAYTVAKSLIVLIFVALLVGLPALAVAFAKLNGRPMYNMLGFFIQFLTSPKILIFYKEGIGDSKQETGEQAAAPAAPVAASAQDSRARLREINKILQEKAQEERTLLNK